MILKTFFKLTRTLISFNKHQIILFSSNQNINNKNDHHPPQDDQVKDQLKPIKITEEDLQAVKKIFENNHDEELQRDILNQLNSNKDSPIKIEEVFTEREQLLSFKLLSCQELEQIMQLYFEELDKQNLQKETNPQFTPSEYSVLFHFISRLRQSESFPTQFQKHKVSIENIINQIIDGCDKIEATQFSAFLWALGTFVFDFDIDVTFLDRQKYLILKAIEKDLESLNHEQLCGIAFSISTLFQQSLGQDVQDCLLKIIAILQKNCSLIPPHQLVILIHSLPPRSTVAAKQLFDYVLECLKGDLLGVSEAAQIAKQLIIIQEYNKSPMLDEMIKTISDQLETKQQLQCSTACELLEQYVNIDDAKNNEWFIKKLIRVIHGKQDTINITDYISFLLSLVRVKQLGFDVDKSIEVLKRVLDKNSIFRITDFDDQEIVTILVGLSALRVDDKPFVQKFVQQIKPRNQNKQDLMKLALSFVIYIRQFEEFYKQIHQACVERIYDYNPIEREKLKKAFQRVSILFPESPYLK